MSVCVCLEGNGAGFTCAEGSGVVELVRSSQPDLEMEGQLGVPVLHVCVEKRESDFQPLHTKYDIHTYPCCCIRQGSPGSTPLPGAPQMLLHALMTRVTA